MTNSMSGANMLGAGEVSAGVRSADSLPNGRVPSQSAHITVVFSFSTKPHTCMHHLKEGLRTTNDHQSLKKLINREAVN